MRLMTNMQTIISCIVEISHSCPKQFEPDETNYWLIYHSLNDFFSSISNKKFSPAKVILAKKKNIKLNK
jgi:hypothetical protein